MESFVKVLFRPSAQKSIGITKTTMSTAMSTAISTDLSVDITHSKQDPKRLYNPHWERKLLAQQNIYVMWSLQLRTWICSYNGMHSWQKNCHSPTTCSLRTQTTFHNATTSFPTKWCLRNQHQISILMAHHCPDLGISTNQNQIWAVMCPWYEISALVLPTLFCGETSGGITKWWLFSSAILLLSVSKLICNKS